MNADRNRSVLKIVCLLECWNLKASHLQSMCSRSDSARMRADCSRKARDHSRTSRKSSMAGICFSSRKIDKGFYRGFWARTLLYRNDGCAFPLLQCSWSGSQTGPGGSLGGTGPSVPSTCGPLLLAEGGGSSCPGSSAFSANVRSWERWSPVTVPQGRTK